MKEAKILTFVNFLIEGYKRKKTQIAIRKSQYAIRMKVKVINKSVNSLPGYETIHAAGMDLRANLEQPVLLKPLGRALIPTGLFIEIPSGYEAQIRPRSGLAAKNGVTVLNAPGTIDADYRGEVKIILINHGSQKFKIERGDRIAQGVFAQINQANWHIKTKLNDSVRGHGGFGSTDTTTDDSHTHRSGKDCPKDRDGGGRHQHDDQCREHRH